MNVRLFLPGSIWYPPNGGLGEGLDSAKEKIPFLLPGIETRITGPPTCSLVTMLSYSVHGVVLHPFCEYYFFYGYDMFGDFSMFRFVMF
jgi:hypothetical protein